MTINARAIQIHEYGSPEVLKLETIVVADPGAGEVRIRNTVIGLNAIDLAYRRGAMSVSGFPAILGDEAAGIVECVGPGVTSVKVGDRVVCGATAGGAYATARLYRADRVVKVPDCMDDEQAAGCFLKGLTARYLLKDVVSLERGDTILYHAAAGGVGQIFGQWAKALGLRVIGTVSNDHDAAVARWAGYDHVVNCTAQGALKGINQICDGRPLVAVYDPIGTDNFASTLKTLASGGTLVRYSRRLGSPPVPEPDAPAPKTVHLNWISFPHYTASAEHLAAAAADLMATFEAGLLKVDPTHIYPFGEIVGAHYDLEAGRLTGAAVLSV